MMSRRVWSQKQNAGPSSLFFPGNLLCKFTCIYCVIGCFVDEEMNFLRVQIEYKRATGIRNMYIFAYGGGDLVAEEICLEKSILAQFFPSLLTIVAEFFPYFFLDIKFKICTLCWGGGV